MKIAICDDNVDDALHLRSFVRGHEVSVYYDAESLLADIEEKGLFCDLYLLDIYMEDSMSGIELAQRLRKADEEAVLCFVSTSSDFYREAYDLYAVQYLLKPVRENEMLKLLDRVEKGIAAKREKCLCIKCRGQMVSIPYNRILYISSSEHTIFVYCTDGTVQECKGKLNELEQQMDGNVFTRCHQSFLVNMYQVNNLKGNELSFFFSGGGSSGIQTLLCGGKKAVS